MFGLRNKIKGLIINAAKDYLKKNGATVTKTDEGGVETTRTTVVIYTIETNNGKFQTTQLGRDIYMKFDYDETRFIIRKEGLEFDKTMMRPVVKECDGSFISSGGITHVVNNAAKRMWLQVLKIRAKNDLGNNEYLDNKANEIVEILEQYILHGAVEKTVSQLL